LCVNPVDDQQPNRDRFTMLYVLGMSHAISVLRAMDAGSGASHSNYGPTTQEEATWQERPVPPLLEGAVQGSMQVFLLPSWNASLKDGVLAATGGYWQLLDTIPRDAESRRLVSFMGGNEHSVLSIVEHPQPYDFYAPECADLDMLPGRQPIALGTIETLLQARMNSTVALLTALRLKQPELRILHVMPPPPLASEAQMLQQPEIFRELFAARGITPLSVRVKIYRVYCRLLAQTLAGLGIDHIPHPPDVTDATGGLRDAFALGCTHGNEAYGQRVAQQLAIALKD
jgi:hypothetical protein